MDARKAIIVRLVNPETGRPAIVEGSNDDAGRRGEISDRIVVQGEGRWTEDPGTFKVYNRNIYEIRRHGAPQTSEGTGDDGKAGSGNHQVRQATRSRLANSRFWWMSMEIVSLGVSVCWDGNVGARLVDVVVKLGF